jgi:hypothetical protein
MGNIHSLKSGKSQMPALPTSTLYGTRGSNQCNWTREKLKQLSVGRKKEKNLSGLVLGFELRVSHL